jgi:hypothetical protein
VVRHIRGTGGGGGNKITWPPTRWNPSGLKTNCGFCAISYAREQQKGTLVDADQLYLQTLQRLGIDRHGDEDPIPRSLIFPQFDLDKAAIKSQYHELECRGRGPSDYTIWSVAHYAGLDLKSGDKKLLDSLVEFAANSARGWKLDTFVQARMTRPELAGRASFKDMKSYVMNNLKGHAIIGSIGRGHFVNVTITPRGELKVFDPQKGITCDGRHIKAEFGRLDLFERVTTSQSQ